MDFMQRGGPTRTNGLTRNGAAPVSSNPAPEGGKKLKLGGNGTTQWSRIGFLILLFAGTILAVATLFFLAFGKGVYGERQFVQKDQLQAVFINVNGTNGGQVYFGNIADMTQQYIRLTNVFYIQNQQNTQNAQANSAYNLVKLGCELHGPEDQMIINRSEVFFWENLKSDSQVAQKVAEFRKQNPNGQKCSDAANSGAGQQSGNTQSSTSTNGSASTPANSTNNANDNPATNTNNTTTNNNTRKPTTPASD